MTIGPVQLLLIKFDSPGHSIGPIREEIADLRRRGLLRLLDLLFVAKASDGQLSSMTYSDLSDEQAVEFGSALKQLLGLEEPDLLTDAQAFELVEESLGLSTHDLPALAESIAPGEAALALLVEHTWAGHLRGAIDEAGGHMAMQALLTRDVLALVGSELAAVAEAERTIDLAQSIRGAVMLDALLTVADAEDNETAAADLAAADLAAYEEVIKNQVTAEVLHALASVGVIDKTEVVRAIDSLHELGLLDDHALDAARAQIQSAHEAAAALGAEDAPE